MCICTIKVKRELKQLRIPRTVVFPRAAREPGHNDGCGPLPEKSLETCGLASVTQYSLACRSGGGGGNALTEKWGPRGPRRMLAPVKTRDV